MRFLPHQYSRIENETGIKIPDAIKGFISEYADLSVRASDFSEAFVLVAKRDNFRTILWLT